MLFHKGEKRLVCYPYGSLAETCALPEGTLRIGAKAFFWCSNLVSIALPDSLTAIDDNPFVGTKAVALSGPSALRSGGRHADRQGREAACVLLQ